MTKILASLFAIAFLALSFFQFYAGYIGISHYFGPIWASVVIIFTVLTRFMLPITIAAFFCAVNVWHWPLIVGFLFVMPSLIFLVPGIFVIMLAFVKRYYFAQSPKVENRKTTTMRDEKAKTIEGEYEDHTKEV